MNPTVIELVADVPAAEAPVPAAELDDAEFDWVGAEQAATPATSAAAATAQTVLIPGLILGRRKPIDGSLHKGGRCFSSLRREREDGTDGE
jgi:hypothetical protein